MISSQPQGGGGGFSIIEGYLDVVLEKVWFVCVCVCDH